MMGWSAEAVGRSSPWHLMRAFEGFRQFHCGPPKPKAPTEAEFDEAVRRAHGG